MNTYKAFLPFLVFVVSFLGLNILAAPLIPTIALADVSIYAAFIAILSSFFTFKRGTKLQEKINVFMEGASQQSIIHLCFIFINSSIFTYVLTKSGCTQTAVNIALTYMPHQFLLPGAFITTALFSFCIGTSMGTIITFMPILYEVFKTVQMDPAIAAGIVVSGAIFGDNLSLISDTTLASTKVTQSTVMDKFIDNIKIALPAAICTIGILAYLNTTYVSTNSSYITQSNAINWSHIIPYTSTFVLALFGYDILTILLAGTTIAFELGFMNHSLQISDILSFFHYGFYESKSMVSLVILVIMLSGLSHIITHNGGINALLELLKKDTKKSAFIIKLQIFFLVFLVNCAIAINTISIIISGPVAVQIGVPTLSRGRIANILDLGSCVSQGILPYSPQILLAASICFISPIAVLPFVVYPYMMGFITLINLYITSEKSTP